jgi:hypothetical protein
MSNTLSRKRKIQENDNDIASFKMDQVSMPTVCNPVILDGDIRRAVLPALIDGHVDTRAVISDGVVNDSGNVPVGRVCWPQFDAATRASVIKLVLPAFRDFRFTKEHEKRVIAALVGGHVNEFWAEMRSLGHDELELCDLWSSVCMCLDSDWSENAETAACLVSCFVQAGMPLREPFTMHPNKRAILLPSPPAWEPVFQPLSTAVRLSARITTAVANAILDLPASCGLDVSARWPTPTGAPAIAYIDACLYTYMGIGRANLRLFERLLERTDRSVINSGVVHIRSGSDQCFRADTHILVANICKCSIGSCSWALAIEFARAFIVRAQPDGSGTDLTGGVVDVPPPSPSQSNARPGWTLWPDGKYRGAAALVDELARGIRVRRTEEAEFTDKDLAALDTLARIRSQLVATLGCQRAFRRDIHPALAAPLTRGSIHLRDLHRLVAAYILVPLHDESHLHDPLIVTAAAASAPQKE